MKKTFLLVALTLLNFWGPPTACLASEKNIVILISFDGFRWDYIQKGKSPNLEKLAAEGVAALSLKPVFPSKTFPNHYSTVTGLYAESHGLIANNYENPATGEKYSLRDTAAVRNPRWYQGEAIWETAERQGVICANYFWPGSEIGARHRRATYIQHYEHERPYKERVDGVLEWLKLPERKRPRFITLYFDAVDSKGHKFGPNAPETEAAIAQVDSLLGYLRDGIEKIGISAKTNIVITSDHGMAEIDASRSVNVEELLGEIQCRITDSGPIMFLRPKNASVEETAQALRKNAKYFRVLTRDNMPKDYHFSRHPFIPPIILLADLGWSLTTNRGPLTIRGHHGFDPNHIDMHGIFYAAGPNFKKGFKTGTQRNIDIYPLLCKILGIIPRQNIDGKLEMIESVLVSE